MYSGIGERSLQSFFNQQRTISKVMWGAWSFNFWILFLMMLQQGLGRVVLGVVDDDYTRADFPDDFVFGAGTSAYQVEGAAFEDGRTPSIWDTFAHQAYYFEGNGDVACDQYHKYNTLAFPVLKNGNQANSLLSDSLFHDGRGDVNPKGLDYYNNLINELIMHGIQPHATLYHIDTPQTLEDEYGGWLSWKIVEDFTAYADVCFKEFGDRVLHWTTINEPNIVALGGYDNGCTPPGRCSLPFGKICPKGNSSTEPYIAVHNMLLAHSSAVKLYKKKYKAIQHGFVGINIYAPWFFPNSKAKEDLIATQRSIDFFVGWIMQPMVFGDYPDIMKQNAGTRIPAFTPDQSKLLKGSFDFIGLNYYYVFYVESNSSSLQMNSRDVIIDMAGNLIVKRGDTPPGQLPISPFGLYQLLEYIKHAYGNPPVYIHENGQEMQRNGTLEDTARVKYMHSYIGAVLDAIRNGSNTKGYILWSFLDGYELLGGYRSSYGLYYVDLDDKELRRYPKLSAHWYSNFIKGRSTSLSDVVSSLPKASH